MWRHCSGAAAALILLALSSSSLPAALASSRAAAALKHDRCAPAKYSLPARPSRCVKLLYLHIPKTGGHGAVAAFAGLSGYRLLENRAYDFKKLLAAELANPRRQPRLIVELHTGQPAYRHLHADLLKLKAAYQAAGCKVALATVLREPVALAQSWQSYCSKAFHMGRKRALPGFLSWAAHCGRRNVMLTWLHLGGNRNFCSRANAPGMDEALAQRYLNMLGEFDIVGDIRTMPAFMGAVFQFLEVPSSQCSVPRVEPPIMHRRLPSATLRKTLPPPPRGVDVCVVNSASLQHFTSVALPKAQSAKTPTLPDNVIERLVRWDRLLYRGLRKRFGLYM